MGKPCPRDSLLCLNCVLSRNSLTDTALNIRDTHTEVDYPQDAGAVGIYPVGFWGCATQLSNKYMTYSYLGMPSHSLTCF